MSSLISTTVIDLIHLTHQGIFKDLNFKELNRLAVNRDEKWSQYEIWTWHFWSCPCPRCPPGPWDNSDLISFNPKTAFPRFSGLFQEFDKFSFCLNNLELLFASNGGRIFLLSPIILYLNRSLSRMFWKLLSKNSKQKQKVNNSRFKNSLNDNLLPIGCSLSHPLFRSSNPQDLFLLLMSGLDPFMISVLRLIPTWSYPLTGRKRKMMWPSIFSSKFSQFNNWDRQRILFIKFLLIAFSGKQDTVF